MIRIEIHSWGPMLQCQMRLYRPGLARKGYRERPDALGVPFGQRTCLTEICNPPLSPTTAENGDWRGDPGENWHPRQFHLSKPRFWTSGASSMEKRWRALHVLSSEKIKGVQNEGRVAPFASEAGGTSARRDHQPSELACFLVPLGEDRRMRIPLSYPLWRQALCGTT